MNDVYLYPAQHEYPARVLRLSNHQWRSPEEALAELHFMAYLYDHGVSVPRVYLSTSGSMVGRVTDDYHASLFSNAVGRIPIDEDWNPKLFVSWGRIVGQIHSLSQSYVPLPDVKRRDWNQETWMDLLSHLPGEETVARQQGTKLLDWMETLPKDKKNFGLVHGDLHARNLFVTREGTVTAFDFDDCCYHWFAYDIALILYSVITRHNRLENKSDTLDDHVAWFLEHFLNGYQHVLTLETWWLKAMPDLLRYRRLLLYSFYFQRVDVRTIEGELKKRWLRMKEDIDADEPVTDYSF